MREVNMRYFNQIREAALQEDFHGLIDLLKQGASIDERRGGLTAAGWLARAGDKEAVEFLRWHGASPQGIVDGYALAGKHDEVKFYCDRGIQKRTIVFAYILANYPEQAGEYI